MSVKRNKAQPTKKKMTDAEIHAALRECFQATLPTRSAELQPIAAYVCVRWAKND